jgi:hypothetical protein
MKREILDIATINNGDEVNYVNNQLEKAKKWFINYYSNEDVSKKFKKNESIKKLIDGIQRVSIVVNLRPTGSIVDNAWGWIYTNNLYTIYINYYNFHNRTINASIYDTVVHEMAHLIDFQLRYMGETPSYMEMPILPSDVRFDEYIVSREEDYARIHRLRNLLLIHPFESYNRIGEELIKLSNSGVMYLTDFEIRLSNDNKKLIFTHKYKLRNLTIANIAGIIGNLVINNYLATDIGYLFAKYAEVKNGDIEVNLEKISTVNRMFVKIDKFNNNA